MGKSPRIDFVAPLGGEVAPRLNEPSLANSEKLAFPSENKRIASEIPLRVTPDDSAQLLTVSEVAARLKVPTKSVYLYARRGDIPFIRVGRYLRFNLSEVLAALRKKTEESKPSCLKNQYLLNTVSIRERASRTRRRSLKNEATSLAETKGVSNGDN